MKGIENLSFLRVFLCGSRLDIFHREVAKGAKEKAKDWKRK
jgi:hypothetical protein